MHSNNQIIKFSYHLFVAIILLYLAFNVVNIHLILKLLLVIFALIHLYDCWWFYNHHKNAPI